MFIINGITTDSFNKGVPQIGAPFKDGICRYTQFQYSELSFLSLHLKWNISLWIV